MAAKKCLGKVTVTLKPREKLAPLMVRLLTLLSERRDIGGYLAAASLDYTSGEIDFRLVVTSGMASTLADGEKLLADFFLKASGAETVRCRSEQWQNDYPPRPIHPRLRDEIQTQAE